ncbi:Ribonucleoside-diphosphate reductase subunit M2 [Blyttiomyces sp. JEL0837]|nr:Ribonucleoside-diphosphate reductase subunit M2 [Blyttiomyces sp. JEL0837]
MPSDTDGNVTMQEQSEESVDQQSSETLASSTSAALLTRTVTSLSSNPPQVDPITPSKLLPIGKMSLFSKTSSELKEQEEDEDDDDDDEDSKKIKSLQERGMNMFSSNLDEDWDAPPRPPALLEEPLLVENKRRFVLFPIQYHNIWKTYKNAEARFWSAEELELSDDVDEWDKLSGKEKAALLHCFGLLSLPMEPVVSRLSDEIQIPEARCFFGYFIMQKNIHIELFNVLLDVFQKDEEAKEFLIESVAQQPSNSKKTAWIQTNLTESERSFATRVFALAVFCEIFNTAAMTIVFHLGAPKPEDPAASTLTKTPLPGSKPASLPTSATATPAKSTVGLMGPPMSVGANSNHNMIMATPRTPAAIVAAAAATLPKPILPGVIHGLAKMHADHSRYVQFCRVLLSHCVNPVAPSVAQGMVTDAVEIEMECAREVVAMAGGNLRLDGRDVVLADVENRIREVGERLLTEFGVGRSVAERARLAAAAASASASRMGTPMTGVTTAGFGGVGSTSNIGSVASTPVAGGVNGARRQGGMVMEWVDVLLQAEKKKDEKEAFHVAGSGTGGSGAGGSGGANVGSAAATPQAVNTKPMFR